MALPYITGGALATVGQPGEVHTSAKNPLGLVAQGLGADGGYAEYVYLSGVALTAIGSWVNYDVGVDYSTILLDTDVAATLLGRIAVATAAIVAATYGWYQITGAASGLALTGSTDTKNAFATSTAGSVDDSGAGAEVLVFNAFSTGAVVESTFLQPFVLNRPFMIGITLD